MNGKIIQRIGLIRGAIVVSEEPHASRSGMQYRAEIEGRSSVWMIADTPREAIGALIQGHGDQFAVDAGSE